ncbi:MAG: hypothetical protein LW855_07660, partial [Alphaproteobacteria bacterium]|nr:hypothetical protein [Alphaproteobacteria bacterium]
SHFEKNMPLSFPADTAPLAYTALPGLNTGLSWQNVQRKRLKKFAEQYMTETSKAVQTLRSQGEPDTSLDAVQDTRAGFTELRVRLPVLNQYYRYTLSHGGTGDAAVLAKIKTLVLAWADTNQPTGKPIDETNFEGLLRVIKQRWSDFTAGEQTRITSWLNALKTAKEAYAFTAATGEGSLRYSNHYTHHYKVLLQVYDLLGLTTQYTALVSTITAFAAQNFPFGNGSIVVAPSPTAFNDATHDLPRAAVSAGESLDYIKRDALHYQHYTLEPWLEIALQIGGTGLQTVMDNGVGFLRDAILAPASKHYEFAASVVPFDATRWQTSNPVYLQPNAMYRPDHAARVFMAYDVYKKGINPSFALDDRLYALLSRSSSLPSFWYYYFRWVFGGLYG